MGRNDQQWAVFWCSLLSPVLLGEIPEGALGARVHASIDGTVTAIGERITITQQ